MAQDIASLYPRRNGSIWKHEGKKRWMQWSKPLQDVQILGAIGDDWHGVYRGCYFGDFTRFAVLDIDQGSRYHTLEALRALTIALAEVGLVVTPYQSSNSGGWHLYLFLDNWEPTDEIEQTLKGWLKSNRYEIKSGTLEVFPSGNALRLPLQRGFGWLSENGTLTQKREDLTRDEAINHFLSNLEEGKADWKRAKDLISSQIVSFLQTAQEHQNRLDTEGFGGLFQRGVDWDKYQRGRKYWAEGLSAFSQRTDAILSMGHYLWFGDDSIGLKPMPRLRKAAQRAELIYKRLERHHNGFSRTINQRGCSEVRSDIERACSWTSKMPLNEKSEAYALSDRLLKRLAWLYKITGRIWTVEDLQKGNIRRAENARNRIALAVTQLEMDGQLITKSAVARAAQASRNTVSKYWDLLACCSSDYIGGVGDSGSTALDSLSDLEQSFQKSDLVVLSEPDSNSFENQSVLVPFDLAQLNLEQSFLLKLTSCAEILSGEGEQLNSMKGLRLLSPSYPSSLASGSTSEAHFECRTEFSSTCGINGFPPTLCAGPSHLILGTFFNGAQSVNLTAYNLGASKAVQSRLLCFAKAPCYSVATAYGISSSPPETVGRLALSLPWGTDEKFEIVLDSTHCNFLTIFKNSSSSQFNDKFQLIYFLAINKIRQWHQGRAPPGQPVNVVACVAHCSIRLLWLRYRDALKSKLLLRWRAECAFDLRIE